MNNRILQLACLLNEAAQHNVKDLMSQKSGVQQPANNGKTVIPQPGAPITPPAQTQAGTPTAGAVTPTTTGNANPAQNLATANNNQVSPAQPNTQATTQFNQRTEAIPQNQAVQDQQNKQKQTNAMPNTNNLGAGKGDYGLGVQQGGMGIGNTASEEATSKGPAGRAYTMNDMSNTIDNELEQLGIRGRDTAEKIKNFKTFLGLHPTSVWTNKTNRAFHKFIEFRKSLQG